jgi:hypothetical protein
VANREAAAPTTESPKKDAEPAPGSFEAYRSEAESARQQGKEYEARRVLVEGAATNQDRKLLEYLAAVQETYPDMGAKAYSDAASAAKLDAAAKIRMLERGLTIALRDGELTRAGKFVNELGDAGHPEYRSWLGPVANTRYDVLIPGGIDALSFVALIKPGLTADRFFAQFARTVLAHTCSVNCHAAEYVQNVEEYFNEVRRLESFGKRDGDHVIVTLSISEAEQKRETLKVLTLLGLQLQTRQGKLKLQRSEREGRSESQEIASALGIDQIGMEQAFQTGKSYSVEITDTPVAIFPSAKLWLDAFGGKDAATLPLLFLHSPELTKLYLATAQVDPRALEALLGKVSIQELSARYTDALEMYGSAFALEGAHAAVPGGPAAEAIWKYIVGEDPANPGTFFLALLQSNEFRALAFFSAVSELDRAHQEFVLSSAARAEQLYKLFGSGDSTEAVHLGMVRNSTLAEFLRSVPLDDQGHILFPGSTRIWTLADSKESSVRKAPGQIFDPVSAERTTTIEDESALIARMAEVHPGNDKQRSLLDDFLAVARVDEHRSKPLDPESAFLLARRSHEYSPLYASFGDVASLDNAGFHEFFDALDRIQKQPLLEQNLELGQLYSLTKWICLLRQRHLIDDELSTRLFTRMTTRLGAAGDGGGFAAASIGVASDIVKACGHANDNTMDDGLRICLLGDAETSEGSRGDDYSEVLDQQKAPSLELLKSVFAHVEEILKSASGSGDPKQATLLADLVQEVSQLPSSPLPRQDHVIGREREAILLYDPAGAQKLARELSQSLGQGKGNAQKLAEELLHSLEPQVTLALAAPVYGYYLRSTDLVVSQDPLMLRKHRYLDFAAPAEERPMAIDADFTSSSDGAGSYMQGGFARFALAAGRAAAVGWRQGGTGGRDVIPAQIAALRSSVWDRLQESDQRIVSLRILAAREWIVDAANDAAMRKALSDATPGILSLSRRARLLNGIEDHAWPQVWSSVTLPDLLALGGEHEKLYAAAPKPSPTFAELRRLEAGNDGSRLDILGRIPYQVRGCTHTHLTADAPYEEYERRLLSEDMAERAADFKLFLAYRADSLGIEPAEAGRVAEKLATKAFRSSQMTDYHDWRSLLAAYDSITSSDVERALQQ